MAKSDSHINYADLERFLHNLKANELADLKLRINKAIEEIYEAMETNSITANVPGTLPTASKDTVNNIYVDENRNSYISVNTGTAEQPNYTWVQLNSTGVVTGESTDDTDEYEDVFDD